MEVAVEWRDFGRWIPEGGDVDDTGTPERSSVGQDCRRVALTVTDAGVGVVSGMANDRVEHRPQPRRCR